MSSRLTSTVGIPTASEADDRQAAFRCQAVQRVGAAVSSDWVDDDIDAAASSQTASPEADKPLAREDENVVWIPRQTMLAMLEKLRHSLA